MQKFFYAFILILTFNLFAQNFESETKLQNIIKFGLESQVINAVKNLERGNNRDYNVLLKERYLKTKNYDLKKEILTLYKNFKEDSLKSAVKVELESEVESLPLNFFIEAIEYLLALNETKDLEKLLISLLKKTKANKLSALIKYLGDLRVRESEDELIEVFETYSLNDGVKPTIIIALSKMNSVKYLEKIQKIADDVLGDVSLIAASIKALSILDSKFLLENFSKFYGTKNNTIQLALIEGLSNINSDEAKSYLYEFIYSDNEKIRLASLVSLSKHDLSNLKDMLIFKIKEDPSLKVRNEAINILSNMQNANDVIRDLILKSDLSLEQKLTLYVSLLKNQEGAALSLSLELARSENLEKPSKLLMGVSNILSNRRGSFDSFYKMLLESSNTKLQALAVRGALYNKSTALRAYLIDLKESSNSLYIKNLLKDYD